MAVTPTPNDQETSTQPELPVFCCASHASVMIRLKAPQTHSAVIAS